MDRKASVFWTARESVYSRCMEVMEKSNDGIGERKGNISQLREVMYGTCLFIEAVDTKPLTA